VTGGSLFVPETADAGNGNTWLPTDFARGPWDPNALHGGPVAALVAREVERCQPDPHLAVARLSLELVRPVPLTPLQVTASVTRPGRKVQLIDVKVSADGVDVAWARALRIRTLDAGSEDGAELARRSGEVDSLEHAAPPAGPERGESTPPISGSYTGFHNGGAELRFVAGTFGGRGPSTVWVRLAVPVVNGEEPSPLQRVAAAADFGNGVSSVLDFTRWTFINPDVTTFVAREATGEWICLEAQTQIGTPGIGLARSTLWDRAGRIGQSVQSLFIEPR